MFLLFILVLGSGVWRFCLLCFALLFISTTQLYSIYLEQNFEVHVNLYNLTMDI